MRSMLKKTLSVILAAAMVLSLSAVAFAAAIDQSSTTADDGTELIIGYEDTTPLEDGVLELEGAWVIDETTSFIFSGVDAKAFAYDALVSSDYMTFLASIKELVLDENIVNIGKKAFANLPNLEKVTFKDNAVLGESAFADCAALKTVVFEKDAVISDTAFAGCTALATFKTSEDSAITASKAALADTAFAKNYPIDFVMVGSTLVYYKGNDPEVTLPLNVTAIGDSAFEGNVFLKKINISKNVVSIGDRAFAGCTALSDVNYSAYGEVKSIGKDAFAGTAYEKAFDGEFYTIGTTLIKYLGMGEEYVAIPNTVTAIGEDAFDGCYAAKDPDGYTFVISAILIPASVTEFGENCFGLAKLEDGSSYIPKLYVYKGTPAEEAVKAAGYDFDYMPMLGDVDNNGVIEPEDARLALRMAVKLDIGQEPIIKHAADINCDKVIDAADARQILRVAVGLDFTTEDLLYMPISKVEILMTYEEAMKTIATYGAGYTKTTVNKITGVDMSHEGRIHLYNTLANKGMNNSKVVYTHDTAAARDNLDLCKLLCTDLIQSATCTVDENGRYNITIKFYNTVDNTGCSDVVKAFPVQVLPTYEKAFEGNSWWTPLYDDDYHFQGISKFDLTYTDPTITLTCDKETLKVSAAELSCGYRFNIDGFIGGIAVSSRGYKTGDATLDRLDTVTYSDIVYTAESIPVK